jgi:hypothetical protein
MRWLPFVLIGVGLPLLCRSFFSRRSLHDYSGIGGCDPTYIYSIKDPDFIKEFYKECGREVTLAYTTLNQMKNWAIVVTAALMGAFASFWRRGQDGALTEDVTLVALVAASLSLLFNLRFFIRASICYVNMLRWNRLQNAIASFKMGTSRKKAISESELIDEIDTYYHRWASPVGRFEQVSSNLKLGFGLLLAIPTLVVVVCGINSVGDPMAMAVCSFVISGFLIECYEFSTTRFLDVSEKLDKKDRKRARKEELDGSRRKGRGGVFPGSSSSLLVFLMWFFSVVLSIFVYFFLK